MTAFAIVFLVVAVIYASLMIFLTIGWHRIKVCSNDNGSGKIDPFISIVIAARNEENNIETCLGDLLQQDYPREGFEIIVVDDFSTDATTEIVELITKQQGNVFLLRLADHATSNGGKKNAIATGIKKAKGELIITTDADCRYGMRWLSSFADYYNKFQPEMICGPVLFTSPGGFPGKFVVLEFISLVAAGAGAIGIGAPLMCNGANLAFRRDTYFMEGIASTGSDIVSGDDVFLMHSIAQKLGHQSVHFLKCKDAVVKTPAPINLQEFLMQRIRWGSKTIVYPGSFTAVVALVVFLTAFLLLVSTLALLCNTNLIIPALAAWALKSISDFLMLYPACNFFGEKKLLWWFPLFEPIHVIYITIGGMLSFLPRFTWKGRKQKLTQAV